MYNKITENLVQKVLQNEHNRQTNSKLDMPKQYLLIGENDTNLVKPNSLSKPEI